MQVYCDLKPSNILLDEKGSLKLGGFGLSQKIATVKPFTLQQVHLSVVLVLSRPAQTIFFTVPVPFFGITFAQTKYG